MRRVSLEDVVLLAGKLVDRSDSVRQRLCLELFEARHVRHKVRKRLGAVAAQRVIVPEILGTASRVAHRGMDPQVTESLLSVVNALQVWRERQAARGRRGR
jgi:hypothetical protein